MTSSTKPEVHNVSHCRQRTDSRPQRTCRKYLVEFGLGFGYMWADRQKDKPTDRYRYTPITILCTCTEGEATNEDNITASTCH